LNGAGTVPSVAVPARLSVRDDFENSFWPRTVAVGGWVTLLMVVAGMVYAFGFAAPQHRLPIGAMVMLAGCFGAATLWLVSRERARGSGWMETSMLCWAILTIVAVAIMAALDGGAGSPLALVLLLPTVFASLAYSLRRVMLTAALAELAFLALTFIGSPGTGFCLVFCATLAATAVMAVWQARFHQSWRQQLALSSCTDPLTGLLNRRGLDRAADNAFRDLWHHRRAVTLLIIDLDLFKAYNDTYGHQAGDGLLCWVADRLTEAVGAAGTVARLGGDEFAVLLPSLDGERAEPVVNRVRQALDERAAHCLGRATAPTQGITFDELYRACDSDLYEGKLMRPAEAAADPSPVAFERHRRQPPFSPGAILAGITEAFFVLDEEWCFAYINKPAAQMLDHAPHELLGHSIWDALPETTESKFEEVYRGVVESGSSERFTAYYGPLDTTFSVKASPVPGGISVYFHDVGAEDNAGNPEEGEHRGHAGISSSARAQFAS
jgi:diguanylate cyclase (GGDEF)-like protein